MRRSVIERKKRSARMRSHSRPRTARRPHAIEGLVARTWAELRVGEGVAYEKSIDTVNQVALITCNRPEQFEKTLNALSREPRALRSHQP